MNEDFIIDDLIVDDFTPIIRELKTLEEEKTKEKEEQ